MLDLVWKVGLSAVPLVIGYLLYEKNSILATLCIALGIVFVGIVIISEVVFKSREVRAKECGLTWG